ncbi:MAG: hypothetical protein AAGA85_03835, partial [Bacteroidota bacterium]
NHAEMYRPTPWTSMYLYGGGKESEAHLPNLRRLATIMQAKAQEFSDFDFRLSVDEGGTHSEAYWRREFPKAMKWLFFSGRDDIQHY